MLPSHFTGGQRIYDYCGSAEELSKYSRRKDSSRDLLIPLIILFEEADSIRRGHIDESVISNCKACMPDREPHISIASNR